MMHEEQNIKKCKDRIRMADFPICLRLNCASVRGIIPDPVFI